MLIINAGSVQISRLRRSFSIALGAADPPHARGSPLDKTQIYDLKKICLPRRSIVRRRVLICGRNEMVSISIKYDGDLHCSATHGPSQAHLATDAPTDNKGKGEAFSPTDLVATALGTCMATTIGIRALEQGLDLRGMTVSVQKEMSKDAPRRIVGLPSEVHFPLPPDCLQREFLEQTALNCPVHKSLPPEINRPTKFFWEG